MLQNPSPEPGSMTPEHVVECGGLGSLQSLVAPLASKSEGNDVMTYVRSEESTSAPVSRKGADCSPLLVMRIFSLCAEGLWFTSTSAEPTEAVHVPSSATHARYRSATDGDPGNASVAE